MNERHTPPEAHDRLEAERARELARHTSDIVLIVDQEARVRYLSPSAERLMGYHPDEWLGRNALEVIHPDDVDLAAGAFGRALERPGVNEPLEIRVRQVGNGWRWFELVATNLLENPAIAGVVLCARDITERVEAHEALQRSQRRIAADARRFEAMLANLSDMVTVIDANGNMTYVSPAAERVVGRHAEDRIGASIFEYVHPDDASLAGEKLAQALASPGLLAPFEIRLRHEDGTYRVFDVSVNNLLDDPAVEGIIVNSRDITDRVAAEAALRWAEVERHRQRAQLERHRLEAELAQSQRLESLGRLAGGVAHDFNNLVGVILNYTAALARQLDAGGPAAADLLQIQRAAEQAAGVTHKLLIFGRVDRGNPEVVDVNQLVIESTQLVDRPFGDQISLVTALDSGGCRTYADRTQIEQLLMNLLLNARDALPDGGTITVATQLETSADDEPARRVVLTVTDDGTGMTPDVLRRAFEPFFTTKLPEHGSGLGLATVHAIATATGGHVAIDSQPGAGTSVRVTLPGTQ